MWGTRRPLPRPRKYLPLLRYLEALSPAQQTVSLTFAELETLLGNLLPASAWMQSYWTASSIARTNWERSGFTATLDRIERRVIFTRRVARAGDLDESGTG